MVNIHQCKKCEEKIYYLPIKVDGELKGFHPMNLDKSSHVCVNASEQEAEYLDRMDQAYKEDLKMIDSYREGFDFPRRDRRYPGEDLEA